MARYGIEDASDFHELVLAFKQTNGRDPNDLDKLTLIEELNLKRSARMGDQLDRLEAMLSKLFQWQNARHLQ